MLQQEMLGGGRYHLLEELGRGGMATVRRAQDVRLKREVAIKILHPHLAHERKHRERFQREAEAIARLRHPGIVEVFDVVSEEIRDGVVQPPYLVMEYVQGQTLSAFLLGYETCSFELSAALLLDLLPALEHAHGLQVVHRDLKPENVMVREDGALKIADFGLARLLDEENITRTGSLLGSPAYMAPEQVEGETGGVQVDIFAMGVLLFRLACQVHPFQEGKRTTAAVLQAVALCKYADPELLRPSIGRDLRAILMKSMARDPQERYGSMKEMRVALRSYVRDSGVQQSSVWVKKFFQAPDATEQELRVCVQHHLKKRLRMAVKRRHSIEASDLCNRLLGYIPEDEEVLALRAQLLKQRQWGPVLVLSAVLGVSCLCGLLWFSDAVRMHVQLGLESAWGMVLQRGAGQERSLDWELGVRPVGGRWDVEKSLVLRLVSRQHGSQEALGVDEQKRDSDGTLSTQKQTSSLSKAARKSRVQKRSRRRPRGLDAVLQPRRLRFLMKKPTRVKGRQLFRDQKRDPLTKHWRRVASLSALPTRRVPPPLPAYRRLRIFVSPWASLTLF
ncbi:MAG: serine/threonine-protein kinase, partial [Myxococcota bacterium]